MPGKEISKLFDVQSERYKDNIFISTDGSQFDSTRSRPLRELDIACFEFFLED